jgi:hypothetical protein
LSGIATVAEGSRGLAGSSDGKTAKKEDEKKDGKDKDKKEGKGLFGSTFGLSKGAESKSSQTVASAGARGGVPDRDSVGGSNKNKVTVSVSPEEIAAFKKGIA